MIYKCKEMHYIKEKKNKRKKKDKKKDKAVLVALY